MRSGHHLCAGRQSDWGQIELELLYPFNENYPVFRDAKVRKISRLLPRESVYVQCFQQMVTGYTHLFFKV